MSYFTVITPGPVKKSLEKIPMPWKDRILRVVRRLHDEPFLGEKMTGRYGGQYKVKVWPYRILYRIEMDRKIIILREIEHRGSVSYDH